MCTSLACSTQGCKMALVWVDGFDSYGATEDNLVAPSGILGRKYTWSGNWRVIAPRVAGNGHAINRESGSITTPTLTTDDTLIVGLGLRVEGWYGIGNGTVFGWFQGGTRRLYMYYRIENGEMEIWQDKAGGVYLGGIHARWRYWQYIEIKIDTTAGTLDARLNGATILSLSGITFDSINDVIRLGNQTQPHFDDFYVCDGTGSKNNNFLGPRKVVSIRPTADVGGFQDWTPSTGSDHYAMVDEEECNDDTDYVSETGTDETDLFEMDNVSSVLSGVDGMMVYADARKDDGDVNLRLPIRLSATVDEGSSILVSETSYTGKHRISEDKPGSGDWTPSDVDSAQIGVKVPA